MQLERAKFADNGNCGYVLKPPYLRSRQPTAPDTAAAADTPDAVSAAAAGAPPPPPPPRLRLPPPPSGASLNPSPSPNPSPNRAAQFHDV